MTGRPLESFVRDLPGVRASDDAADRVAYARDLWPRHHLAVRAGNVAQHRPAGIVWPTSTEEVASIVRWAVATGTPIVPFGAGSGVCAGVLPHDCIIVMDLKRMSRWRALDTAARTLDVEAGQMGLPLEEDLNRRGFTLGHFPSSILCSTVGGWVAARSAGQCSGLYGKIEDMVLALECVTGTGEVVTLRHRTSGPNLIPLVIGSEGTMAIVTSATLRLHRKPTARAFAGFSFPTTEHGWEAMRERYRQTYQADGKSMGKLIFHDLEIVPISGDSAMVRGGWHLTMPDGSTPHGLFTLIMKKLPEGWKIIHDHTSKA